MVDWRCGVVYSEFELLCGTKFNDRYIYYGDYKSKSKKIKIRCRKHGITFKQLASSHLAGKRGCKKCRRTSLGEQTIGDILTMLRINFKIQMKFDDCRNKKELPFDFYLVDYNTIVEYDGEQHYIPIRKFGGVKALKQTQLHDGIKNQYCIDNDIKLVRIKYDQFDSIEAILKETLNL